jgi:2-dehydropantoate 2-reductase
MARHGLRIETAAFDASTHVPASSDARVVADADVVLLCVKSPDTEQAVAALLPHLAPATSIVCLQNGVDNADRVRALLPGTDTTAAVVYVACQMAGPGHVRHYGGGELIIEPSGASKALAVALQAAGVPVVVSGNVRRDLWLKLIVNCVYNAISAIGQCPYGVSVASPGIRRVMQDVVGECVAVASAEGIDVAADVDDAVSNIAARMPQQLSSTAQDLARGKRTEIDYLNGYIVRRGEALGIPTPANRALCALVKLLEGRPSALACG